MSEMKVEYLGRGGYLSTAYVTEEPPHTGTNKHTDAPVEVVWDEEYDGWVEAWASDVN